jgi:hypothetical protein
MCVGPFAPPKPPPPPSLPPPPPEPPTKADPAVRRARVEAEKRARSLAGGKSTISTSPQGLLTPESTGTTLLGGT